MRSSRCTGLCRSDNAAVTSSCSGPPMARQQPSRCRITRRSEQARCGRSFGNLAFPELSLRAERRRTVTWPRKSIDVRCPRKRVISAAVSSRGGVSAWFARSAGGVRGQAVRQVHRGRAGRQVRCRDVHGVLVAGAVVPQLLFPYPVSFEAGRASTIGGRWGAGGERMRRTFALGARGAQARS